MAGLAPARSGRRNNHSGFQPQASSCPAALPRQISRMKVKPGDTVKISCSVTRVGDDGMISLRPYGFPYPITIHEDDIDEIVKEPKVRNRRKPVSDKPD